MREGDHSFPFRAELENEWIYIPTPLYAFMTCTEAAVPLFYHLF